MPNYQFGSSGIVFTDEKFAEKVKTVASKIALDEAVKANPDIPEFKLRMQESYKNRVASLMSGEEVKPRALVRLKLDAWMEIHWEILFLSLDLQQQNILRLIDEAVENGVDLNEGFGDIPILLLHSAVIVGVIPAIKALIQHKADIDVRDNLGKTALHVAAGKSGRIDIDIVRELMKAGAGIDARDNIGQTPMHIAAEKNERIEIVRCLTDEGADIDAHDKNRQAPLHIAVQKYALDVVQHLVDKGASIDAQDDRWQTPLHIAVNNGALVIVEYLIDKGANVNIKDGDNGTPLDIAIESLEEVPDDEKGRRIKTKRLIVGAGGKRGGDICE